MVGNIIGIIILIALAVLFGWLAWRSWRARRAVLKWLGVALSGLLVLVFSMVTILAVIGMFKLYAPRGNPVTDIKVESTPQLVARGENIANVVCADCHSLSGALPLSGGRNMSEETGMPLGNLTGSNLTPAGPLKDWSDGEILRAIREGTDRHGHLLAVMAISNFRALSGDDLRAVIAYLRSQPAVQNEIPSESFTLLSVIISAAGLLPIKDVPTPELASAPAKGPTAEYGRYLVGYLDCAVCHGQDLKGGKGGLVPAGPSLQVVKLWTQAQFVQILRTAPDSDKMPWKFFARLDDEELAAVYVYLTSLN